MSLAGDEITIPTPDSHQNISRMIPTIGEMLAYVITESIEQCYPGGRGEMGYRSSTDELTYHLKLSDLDRELFDMLWGIEDVWVITVGRTES